MKLHEHEKSQPMAPAGAQHANKIQGDEVEVVQIMPGTEQTANANSAYSQVTRAKREAHAYLDRETHGDDPEAAVTQSWAKRVEKRTALSRVRERKLMDKHSEQKHEKTADERTAQTMDHERMKEQEGNPREERRARQADERQASQQSSSVVVEEREEEKPSRQEQRRPLRERFSQARQRGEHERKQDRDQDKKSDRERTESPTGRSLSDIRQGRSRGHDVER